MSCRVIDKPNQATYKGEIVIVISIRCPNRYENGAQCAVRLSNKSIVRDVPISELSFEQEPEYEEFYSSTASGAAMRTYIKVIK